MKKIILSVLLTIIAILIIGFGTGKWLQGILFCGVIFCSNLLIKHKHNSKK